MKSSEIFRGRPADMLTEATLSVCEANGITKPEDLAGMWLIHMVCDMVNKKGGVGAMLQLFQLGTTEAKVLYTAVLQAANTIENYGGPNNKMLLDDFQKLFITADRRDREAIFRILLTLCIAIVQCLLKSFTNPSGAPVGRWELAQNFWLSLVGANEIVSATLWVFDRIKA